MVDVHVLMINLTVDGFTKDPPQYSLSQFANDSASSQRIYQGFLELLFFKGWYIPAQVVCQNPATVGRFNLF